MKIKLVLLLFVTAAVLILPQSKHSFQITGGILMPLSSSRGLMTNLQYNYQYNSRFSFYLYTGYGAWDQFKIQYIAESKPGQNQILFEAAYADEHKIIPLGAGAKLNFHSTSWLTTFVSMEVNYAHLSYIRPKLGIAEDTSGIVIGFGGGEPRTKHIIRGSPVPALVHYKSTQFKRLNKK